MGRQEGRRQGAPRPGVGGLRPRPEASGRGMAGPSLPRQEAEALFAALGAHQGGDDGPMAGWDREVRPGWLRILLRWAPPWIEAEDLLQGVLREACAAVHEGHAVRSPGGWLSIVALRRVQKLVRQREKEKEKEKEKEREKERVWLDGVPDATAGPLEVAAELDETNHEREKVLVAARVLPQPYGHVLVWRLIKGLSWQEIRDRLNDHRSTELRPISGRESQKLITVAVEMLREYIAGIDPLAAHPQRYLAKKNPWIGATLPPIGN